LYLQPNPPYYSSALVNQHRSKIFFYVVDKSANTIEGYGIDGSIDRPAVQLWNVNFHSQNEEIQAIAPHPHEAIGSPTVSNADLSIRPKYINKNALAVATVSSTSYVSTTTKKKVYESFVNVYLIDTVTGAIIHNTFFRNAQVLLSPPLPLSFQLVTHTLYRRQ